MLRRVGGFDDWRRRDLVRSGVAVSPYKCTGRKGCPVCVASNTSFSCWKISLLVVATRNANRVRLRKSIRLAVELARSLKTGAIPTAIVVRAEMLAEDLGEMVLP